MAKTAEQPPGPTGNVELPSGLSLTPRLKLILTIYPADPSPKPIDEWLIRRSLLDFLRASLAIADPADDDVMVRRLPDLRKRKRGDPVASGVLFVRDLGFLKGAEEGEERRFLAWRRSVVEKMEGIELNIEGGVKFRLSVELPPADDYQKLVLAREGVRGSQGRYGYNSRAARRPDTLVLTGLPSRWFAEPRVSSKPSMLVTHTIFSAIGQIRNLNVSGDDNLVVTAKEVIDAPIVSGLHCKIWVQFEKHEDLLNALKILCGRSMLKEGSRLRADYEVSWDMDDFFHAHARQYPAARSSIHERITFGDEALVLQSEVAGGRHERTSSRKFRE